MIIRVTKFASPALSRSGGLGSAFRLQHGSGYAEGLKDTHELSDRWRIGEVGE